VVVIVAEAGQVADLGEKRREEERGWRKEE